MSGVYLPGFRAVEKTFRMCVVVGFGHKQRGHLGSVWILHLHRFKGVGRQNAPAEAQLTCWEASLDSGPNFTSCSKHYDVFKLGLYGKGVKMVVPVLGFLGLSGVSECSLQLTS